MDLGFDIAQKENGNIIQSANGDLAAVQKNDAILQEIKNEAITYPGDLFYDEEYGWGLYDFLHRETNRSEELFESEIKYRISSSLAKREYIDMSSVKIAISFNETDTFQIELSFRFVDEETGRTVKLSLDRIGIEVIQE